MFYIYVLLEFLLENEISLKNRWYVRTVEIPLAQATHRQLDGKVPVQFAWSFHDAQSPDRYSIDCRIH